jgi:diacylglycerol O-acyltransferase / wax synthase
MSTTHAMSSADAAWLHMDRPTNLMVINSVLWFDERVDWDAYTAVIRDRLVARFDRFRQRPVDGPLGPHWEDVDPDLELHIHHVALPAPGDRRALEAFVSDRAAMPLDRSRPLWETYLIDGFGDGAAVLTRMHHCIADGIALARVMLTLTDGGPEPETGFSDPPNDGGLPFVGAATGMTKLALDALRQPRHTVVTAIEDARTVAKLVLPGWDPRSAIKGEQRPAHHVAWCDPIDLRRVKHAARTLDATVNDILVSAVTGAVSDQLGGSVSDVHALVPFNLRPLDEPLPRELGNRFGLVLLELPVGIEDPVERTFEVKRRMDAIKHGHEGAISYGILELMGHTPAAVEARLIDYFTAKGSMVLTNVPGPRTRLSVAGAELAGVLVWAPCSGSIGMSVSIFSYAGKVTVGFLTDAGLIPEPQSLAAATRAHALALARYA